MNPVQEPDQPLQSTYPIIFRDYSNTLTILDPHKQCLASMQFNRKWRLQFPWRSTREIPVIPHFARTRQFRFGIFLRACSSIFTFYLLVNVFPVEVFLAPSTTSGFALLRILRNSCTRALIRWCIYAFDALIWKCSVFLNIWMWDMQESFRNPPKCRGNRTNVTYPTLSLARKPFWLRISRGGSLMLNSTWGAFCTAGRRRAS